MPAKILHVASDFEDVREEDFRYETADCVFIFEIKRSIKGLKREHVSKAEDHVQICADMLEEKESKQRVKGILVFSSQIDVLQRRRTPALRNRLASQGVTGLPSCPLRPYFAAMRRASTAT